ncbi:hypothetical protein LINPERHAP1_LOCUS32164, partial [Linum perenne]
MAYPPACRCHDASVLRTSWTEDNPGRRFFTCSRRYQYERQLRQQRGGSTSFVADGGSGKVEEMKSKDKSGLYIMCLAVVV